MSSAQVPEGSGQLPFARRIALGWDIWLDARKLPYQIGDTDLSVALAWADVAPDPRWNGVSADFIVRRVLPDLISSVKAAVDEHLKPKKVPDKKPA